MKTLFGIALLSTPSLLFAQGYPLPSSTAGGTVLCNVSPACNNTQTGQPTNLPLWPWNAPISAFKGRFIDSTGTRDYQAPLRTLRARAAVFAGDRDRVFMMMGSTFAAWTTSSFFTKLGGEMSRAGQHIDPTPLPGEQYLQWDGSVYAETDGWKVKTTDGQDRLYGFDYDDRGYIYLAYSAYGWGIVQDNLSGGGGKMALVSQVVNAPVAPSAALAFKNNGKYYVAIGGGANTCALYDVSTPSVPKDLGTAPLGPYGAQVNYTSAWARTSMSNTSTIIAGVDNAGRIKIYSAASFLAGASTPDATIAPGATTRFKAVTSDGVNFYGIEGGSNVQGSIAVIVPGTPGDASSYHETRYPVGFNWDPIGIRFGGGYLTSWGADPDGQTMHLWRLTNGVPQEIDLNKYFIKAYTSAPTGYSQPPGYSRAIRDVVPVSIGGHDYIVFSDHGLGDVYEIKGHDSVTLSIDRSSGYGTQNPYSPTRANGPFYGDKVTFNTASTSTSIARVTWDFDNPGAADNTNQASSIGVPLTRQWVGATTATEAGRTRNVKAIVYGDPSNFDQISLSLTAPTQRIGIAGTTNLFTTAGSLGGVVFGDNFTDSSDGAVEGHYDVWTVDGTASNSAPNDLVPVGTCGAHTLSLESHYIPYSGSGASITPTLPVSSHFIKSLSGITYEVRPFVADIVVASSDASNVTFRNATRIGSALVSGASTPVTVKWQLLNAANTEVTSQTISSTAGAADTWVVSKSQIQNGGKVVLTVTVDAAQISANSGCSSFVESSKTYPLLVPDPVLSVTGCTNVGSPCTVTASSQSVQDMTNWKYSWSVDGGAATNTTSKTFSPVITTTGAHTIALVASNAIGNGQSSTPVNLAASVCNGAPKNISFSYGGATSGCTSTGCTNPAEPLNFTASAFLYTFQSCDSFDWNFGDGTSSSDRNPSHTYTGSGPYTVVLTVTNSNGSSSSRQTLFGSTTPPPPPPPPNGCNPLPSSNFGVTYSGGTSTCTSSNGKPCAAGESIHFVAGTGTYNPQSCDTFTWTFGDGQSGSGTNPFHTYTAPGTYPITLTVTNTATSGNRKTATGSVVVGAAACNAPHGSLSMTYQGVSCATSAPGTPCTPGESLKLTATLFLYNVQSCDTFEWSFGDGTPNQTTTAGTINHTFSGGGTFNVAVTLKNSAGQLGPSSVGINFGQPATEAPHDVAIAASATSIKPGASVNFSGTALPSQISGWEWDFGDNTAKISGQTATHQYTREGAFTVTLKATNSLGSAIATKQIVVSNGRNFAFLLPVVAHLAGQQGSQWRTDLQIFNPDMSKSLDVTVSFKGVDKTLTLNSSTLVIEDFVANFLKAGCSANPDDACFSDSGPVIIRGVAPVTVPQMWTRTYQAAAGGGTFGQLIPAVPIETSASASTGAPEYVVAGLESSSRFRTNLGLVNAASTPTTLTVTVRDATGGIPIGTPFNVVLNPYSLEQIADLDKRIGGLDGAPKLPADKPYSVTISNPSGAALLAYASIIDQVSNDPVFVTAQPKNALGDAALRNQLVPGVGHLTNGNWRSDVAIYNADGAGTLVDLTYFDQSGTKVAEAKSVPLAGSAFLRIQDLVTSGVLTPVVNTDTYGTLRVDTPSSLTPSRFPVVFARTYSDGGASGTFGQGIPAFAQNSPNVKNGTPAYIAGVRKTPNPDTSDTAHPFLYVTNIGLLNPSDQVVIAQVTLLDRTTGSPLGITREYTLAANQSMIQPDIFDAVGSAGATSATARISVTQGPGVWAFASIIDRKTLDPQYVPAAPLN